MAVFVIKNIKKNEKYSNLYIISNNSSKFKYEYGGYKIGFEFVDAPYYIFMQGTNLFTRKKNLEECIISPFIYVREVDEYKESPEIIIAQNMFKSQEVEDLSADAEDYEEAVDATEDDVMDLEAAADELDIEVQDTADAPVEEPAPDVETQEQEV